MRLGDADVLCQNQGWELRMFPSTRRQATVGGYVCGGAAGVGSIRYGQLRDAGSVLALKVVTCEPLPGQACANPATAPCDSPPGQTCINPSPGQIVTNTPYWSVPRGYLQWNTPYEWSVTATSSAGGQSTTAGPMSLIAEVPQPDITSGLGGGNGKPYEPLSGNFTTSATDAAVAAAGVPA